MKKIYSFLLLSTLLLLGAQNVWATARTFAGSEKLYFKNMYPTDWSACWKASDCDVYAYFYGGSSDATWASDPAVLYAGNENEANSIYYITVPAGNYSYVILTRESLNREEEDRIWSGNDFKGQTYNIELDETKLYLGSYDASDKSGSVNWYTNLFTLPGMNGDWDTEANPFEDENWCKVNIEQGDNMSFKVHSGGTWYGWTDEVTHNLSSNAPSTVISNTNGGSGDAWIVRNVSGDYIFKWNHATTTLSVIYPGSTYSRSVSADEWGTVCVPYAVADLTTAGAKFYNIIGKDASKIYIEEVNNLEAGKPYIFHAEAEGTLTLTYGTSAALAQTNNGLIGTYVAKSVVNNYYIIYNGQVCKVYGASVTCGANRAYIDIAAIEGGAPSSVAGRRIVEMPLAPENATALSDINGSEDVVKFIENGRVLIRRNGVVYTTTGQIVK